MSHNRSDSPIPFEGMSETGESPTGSMIENYLLREVFGFGHLSTSNSDSDEGDRDRDSTIVKRTLDDLHTASGQGNVTEVNAVLDNNPALLNKLGGGFGRTALHHAVEGGHLPVAELLLNRGCKIDKQNKYGMSALMWASVNPPIELARMLLLRGADLTLRGNDSSCSSKTALEWAEESGRGDVVTLIEKETVWRRRRNCMMFLNSMLKASSPATAPSGLTAMKKVFSMDEIIRLITKML
jgi:ankyrin repeat protein